ncbi:MAG: hypothetical protein NTU53_05805 [Planctomycetota bacterium]|nr:hypothetical protein [Planctomycetota bacterium]
MRLQSIKFIQYEGGPRVWTLEELALGETNLVVGRNACGKTRTLNIIHNLARLISGRIRELFDSGDYVAKFRDGSDSYEYRLKYAGFKVTQESFIKNNKVLLERGAEGRGKIAFEKASGEMQEFQHEDSVLAVCARKGDTIQHSFLEPLHSWARSLYHYSFGGNLGQSSYAGVVKKEDVADEVMSWQTDRVVVIWVDGEKRFPGEFERMILSDMARLDYPIDKITVAPPIAIRFQGVPVAGIVGLSAKESDLIAPTEQFEMSDGMFCALSLLIQVNYAIMTGRAACVVIDDSGEGLDFERSCKLIELLMEKTSCSKVQLIMSTNDRFVMNAVPLKAWTILKRRGHLVKVFNYINSKSIFDEFQYMGLNNFDFLAMDFVEGEGSGEKTEEEAEG